METGRAQKKSTATDVATTSPEDRASFSSAGAVSVSSLQAQVMQTPEIRQDRVAALKSAISSGQYAIEPDKIADAMLNESAG